MKLCHEVESHVQEKGRLIALKTGESNCIKIAYFVTFFTWGFYSFVEKYPLLYRLHGKLII
jgi:hypothetical protein